MRGVGSEARLAQKKKNFFSRRGVQGVPLQETGPKEARDRSSPSLSMSLKFKLALLYTERGELKKRVMEKKWGNLGSSSEDLLGEARGGTFSLLLTFSFNVSDTSSAVGDFVSLESSSTLGGCCLFVQTL